MDDANSKEEWQARGYFLQFNRADCPECKHEGPHTRLTDELFRCWRCKHEFDPMAPEE